MYSKINKTPLCRFDVVASDDSTHTHYSDYYKWDHDSGGLVFFCWDDAGRSFEIAEYHMPKSVVRLPSSAG